MSCTYKVTSAANIACMTIMCNRHISYFHCHVKFITVVCMHVQWGRWNWLLSATCRLLKNVHTIIKSDVLIYEYSLYIWFGHAKALTANHISVCRLCVGHTFNVHMCMIVIQSAWVDRRLIIRPFSMQIINNAMTTSIASFCLLVQYWSKITQ